MRSILNILIAAIIFIVGRETPASAGWGVESNFTIYTNPGFEFSLSYPRQGWDLTERRQTQDDCSRWSCYVQADIDNRNATPTRTSRMSVRFFSEVPYGNLDQLLQAVRLRHPEISADVWRKTEGDGWGLNAPRVSSGDLPGGQPDERISQEYYIVGVGQVVQIETSAFPENNGSYWIEVIRNSINRLNANGPEVLDLRWDKTEYNVGDVATLSIEVEDLPGAITEESLMSLQFPMDDIKYSLKRLGFSVFSENPSQIAKREKRRSKSLTRAATERSRFQVSMRVASHFSGNDLLPKTISLKNEYGGFTGCTEKEKQLQCSSFQRNPHSPKLTTAWVNNPSPDRSSPDVIELKLDSEGGLRLESQDESGLAYVRLTFDGDSSLILFPNDIAAGKVYSLSWSGNWGRNVIKRIDIHDANNLKTTFRTEANSTLYSCKQERIERNSSGQYSIRKIPCLKTFPVMTFVGGKKR